MGLEPGFVVHGRDLVYLISQIEEFQIMPGAEIYEVENVQGTRAPTALLGIKVEVDGIEPGSIGINNGNSQEFVPKPIADFETAGNGADKKTAVIFVCRISGAGKTIFQKPIKELQVFLGHGQGRKPHPYIAVFFQNPTLITVGFEVRGPDTDGQATAAVLAVHAIDAVAVATISAPEKIAHGVGVERMKERLMIGGGVGQIIGALDRNIDKVLLQIRYNAGSAFLVLIRRCHPECDWAMAEISKGLISNMV